LQTQEAAVAEQLIPEVETIGLQLTPSKAPDVRVGGFSIVEIAPEPGNISQLPGVVIQKHGRNGQTAPIEESTGIPLPLWSRHMGNNTDNDHGYFYKENYVHGSQAVKALRLSRLQWVNRYAHDRKHADYRGILPPDNEDDIYRQIVLNLAGYVPRFALKVINKEAIPVELTPSKRKTLRHPNIIKSEGNSIINKFLVDYAYTRGFTEDEHSLIEEFISITPGERQKDKQLQAKRWELGMKLTGRAIGFANDPLNQEFAQARRQEALRLGAPVCAWLVVKNFLIGKERVALDALEQRLTAEFA
jgi:hypothetical protein